MKEILSGGVSILDWFRIGCSETFISVQYEPCTLFSSHIQDFISSDCRGSLKTYSDSNFILRSEHLEANTGELKHTRPRGIKICHVCNRSKEAHALDCVVTMMACSAIRRKTCHSVGFHTVGRYNFLALTC